MMRTELVTDIKIFENLREEWNALLARSPCAGVFLRHEWLFTWWEVFGAPHRLFIMLCREKEGGELLGVLPAYRERRSALWRTLRLLGSRHVSSDFLGMLVDPQHQGEVMKAIADRLRFQRAEWDLLDLDDLEPRGALVNHLQYALGDDWKGRISPGGSTRCPYIRLPADWETFLRTLSKKMRSNVRYFRKALGKCGEVEVERVDSVEGGEAALEDLMRLRREWLRDRGYRWSCPPEAYRTFHARAWKRMLPEGLIRIRFLCLDGRRVAAAYVLRLGTSAYFYQTAFDKAYARHSVGSVLLGHIIEEAISEGCTRFEFLRGEENYKFSWGEVGVRETLGLKVYNASLAGTFCRAWNAARGGTGNLVRKVRRTLRPMEAKGESATAQGG